MIYIDASRYNNTAKRTGVENYSFHLINELVRLKPHGITLISPKKIDLPVKQIIISFPRLWTQVRLSWEILRNKKIDNLFVPSHLLPLAHPANSTITIHDVAFKHHPESYGRLSRWYLDYGARQAVKKANRIIVPSDTTKLDLIHLYKANPDKIAVIPLGFSPSDVKVTVSEAKKIMGKWKLDIGNYFLYLGRIEHKKNTDNLIKAFQVFAHYNKKVKLVLAGFPGRGGTEILRNIPPSVAERIVVTGYVDEKTKEVLLKNALCFIFPSRYEGFGLPLLEAMHAGIPIIASKIPTSYEIAKGNALFFETENPSMLAHLMARVAESGSLREKMVKQHKETLKKYSWKECAEKTLELFN
ncbi:glycosyltransferase family 4 protein [Candidatus Peregrinibacteria bacterium]|nr:glycosyltransferase family 4 protein [Candidatus Peregrinibacteria bacterium]